jgi:IclR family transcriptional regulator, mhp operon transcriptional activator
VAISKSKRGGSIRSVVRSLQVLRLVNEQQGLTLKDICVLSNLPKPTVYRILQTLRREGYVEPDGIRGVHHVARKALELSAGYTERTLIVKVAAPIALATTRKAIKWPLAIGTLDRGTIIVRYSSMPYSPLGVANTTLGHRHDLLESAMGHAYLIACDPTERHNLAQLLKSDAPRGGGADIQSKLDAVIANSRLGYGLRLAQKKGESATLAIAIHHDQDVLAVLSMTTFGTVMNASFITRMLPTLRATAAKIEAAYVAAIEEPDPKSRVSHSETIFK